MMWLWALNGHLWTYLLQHNLPFLCCGLPVPLHVPFAPIWVALTQIHIVLHATAQLGGDAQNAFLHALHFSNSKKIFIYVSEIIYLCKPRSPSLTFLELM
jgi:hypothetical protein